MLSVERYEIILEQLDKEKIIKVSELSPLLGVTEKTIRVDLEMLERRGLLKRIHGGAVLPEGESRIFPINERQSMRSDLKTNIAKEALKLIEPGETILMDGGSTTQALADLLGDFPVTVITNDIQIATTLIYKEKVQLIVLGGTRIGTSSSLIGAEATELLKRIRVKRFFCGTTGVSVNHGLTVLNNLHADWKRQVIQSAEKVTLLADSTKFEKVALIQFASLEEVDEIITDDKLTEDIKEELVKKEVSVTIVAFK
ncbi:DeoR/GlpR family DNA-binding transcription regulator [Evansella sp. AB-P1]|uniref:DeoR/GlpR family DNA-binding transcription regulator n=1 Tax=Evansella sp. AB-P1 TaxID=3037653 RepID=UPI00241DFA27|nr:DeoR/GlpR family DNA-binding transcription regulator [Evansella sp. AB-P1]MDG5787875.1 DeoR/GlpR family DNA-binding transcription regulator [Evansella sp. AB-P1]